MSPRADALLRDIQDLPDDERRRVTAALVKRTETEVLDDRAFWKGVLSLFAVVVGFWAFESLRDTAWAVPALMQQLTLGMVLLYGAGAFGAAYLRARHRPLAKVLLGLWGGLFLIMAAFLTAFIAHVVRHGDFPVGRVKRGLLWLFEGLTLVAVVLAMAGLVAGFRLLIPSLGMQRRATKGRAFPTPSA